MSEPAIGHHARRTRRLGRALAIASTLAALVAVPSGSVLAHTDFESSEPADGAVVDAPVEVVTVTFTRAAEPAGEGFAALDGGVLREPTEVIEVGDRRFDLRFDPPLSDGEIGIRWSVRAGDAHPISGAFTFEVAAAVGVEPSVEPASGPDTGAAPPVTLDEFLDTAARAPDDRVGGVGRAVSLLAVTLGLGAFAFAATALRGTRGEVAGTIIAVRAAGAIIALGAVIELAGSASRTGESIVDTITTSGGFATLLRFVGGLALAAGLRTAPHTHAKRVALSAAVVDHPTATLDDPGTAGTWRWTPQRDSAIAVAGIAAILMSFWFDGHTVTKGWRPLHALVDTVHVAAGSIWVGGVFSMAVLLWVRHRAGRAAGAAALVVRFSPIATLALVAIGVAGSAMAAMVLDAPGDLLSTEWGQVLLLKTSAVAVAAGIGGYNHFVLRPALDRDPADPRLAERVRSSVSAEAILLVFVVIVTATLVAAATA